jgi:phosphatidylglycerophosphate synthase
MNQKLRDLWETKNKNDEWWSSFVTSPLAILANWFVVDLKWISPNLVTLLSLLVAVASGVLIVLGGQINFYIAAVLINASHVLDCMDGQMAKYRGTSSRFGNYFDKVTDQIQIFIWFSAVSYASYVQSHDVTVVFLAFTGVTFYSLRVYVKYVTIFIEVEHNSDYLANSSSVAASIGETHTRRAGLGTGFRNNLVWFLKEQRKFFLFNEAVFVFMLSAALVFDVMVPMLWVFAISQIYFGVVRSWQRGRQVYLNQHGELLKPMEK